MQTILETLQSICQKNNKTSEDYTYTFCHILAGMIEENHDITDFDESELIEALNDIAGNYSFDFSIEFDGAEYRVIHESDIWCIYVDTIRDIVQDCYSDIINLDKVPSFIAVAIDWEATAHNAYADGYGYGHTFSSYDGSELFTINHCIFRTN